MFIEIGYRRDAALQYAKQWAMDRNPKYYNFDEIGGDCTNFASQCIYAGSSIMNFTSVLGWYYISSTDRAPAWSGVQYFYNFLVRNKSVGPYAVQTAREEILPGDIVQLGNGSGFYHSPVIVHIENGHIFVAAHTNDAYMRPLDSYVYEEVRFLHIQGVRDWKN